MKNTLDFRNQSIPAHSIYSLSFDDDTDNAPLIQERIYEASTDKTIATFSIHHSLHSFARANFRGINSLEIMHALEYGEITNKQGLFFYLVKMKNIPQSVDRRIAERINNLVVVTNSIGDTIITCYKSKDASKYLRKKSKMLCKNYC